MYLFRDTSENCDSKAYKAFLVADSIFIIMYQSIPLVYLCLLLQHRRSLAVGDLSSTSRNVSKEGVVDPRKSDESLRYISFLWQVTTIPSSCSVLCLTAQLY